MTIRKKNPLKTIVLILISFWILILLFSLLSSCTCERKLARIKKNCPELVKKDTLKIRDTIYTMVSEKDTIFYYNTKDTVVIKEGKLTVKYFYNTKDSLVYISGKCDTIRIIREVKVPYEKIVYQDNVWTYLRIYWWLPLLIVFLFFIYIKFFYNGRNSSNSSFSK